MDRGNFDQLCFKFLLFECLHKMDRVKRTALLGVRFEHTKDPKYNSHLIQHSSTCYSKLYVNV